MSKVYISYISREIKLDLVSYRKMATSRRDSAWIHCTEVVEGNRGQIKCNYCSKVVTGITRFKQHLAIEGTDVTGCPNVPSEVSEEMRNRLDQLRLERPATRLIIPSGPTTRPGGTIPLGAVNQLPGYYLQSPQGPNQLGLMMTRSARAVTLPSAVLMVRPNGNGSQNQTEPENICWFHQFRPVYCWVDGFWHGPFYGTSTGPLP